MEVAYLWLYRGKIGACRSSEREHQVFSEIYLEDLLQVIFLYGSSIEE
jgi:hypothetical protein